MLKLASFEEIMCRTQTFELFLKFRSGMASVEDTECFGHCFSIPMELCIRISSGMMNCELPFLHMFCGSHGKVCN